MTQYQIAGHLVHLLTVSNVLFQYRPIDAPGNVIPELSVRHLMPRIEWAHSVIHVGIILKISKCSSHKRLEYNVNPVTVLVLWPIVIALV